MTTIEALPEDIVSTILDKLLSDKAALCSFSETCKWFYGVESRWRRSVKIVRDDLIPTLLRRYRNLTLLYLPPVNHDGDRGADIIHSLSCCPYLIDVTIRSTAFLAACPATLRSLDFTNSSQLNLPDDEIPKCLKRFSSTLQRLRLNFCRLSFAAFETIASFSSSLIELSLSNCHDVTDDGVSCVVRRHTQIKKLHFCNCKLITSVAVDYITKSCTNLTSLELWRCKSICSQAFALIGQRCLLLQELNVLGVPSLDDPRLKTVTDAGIASIVQSCLALESIDMSQCPNLTDASLKSLSNCPRLTDLDVSGCFCITSEGLAAIAAGCRLLTTLKISYCSELTDAALISLSKCSRLKTLYMSNCGGFTSEGLPAVAAGCSELTDTALLSIYKCARLKYLCMSHCGGFTSEGLSAVAAGCRLLRTLNISGCSELTDAALVALSKCPRLKFLSISGCHRFTSEGLAALAAECEQLSISE